MNQSATAALSQLIPVSLLTGFLGSGKTTVLNHLLRQKEFAKTLVIVNEFGKIGLDHDLVESSTEDMVLLQSGCLCCTIRGDLIHTLRSVFRQRVQGEIAAFERVVIETTGLADPSPILHVLMTDALIAARFSIDGVITTVDAATGSATLDLQIESVKQAAVADRLLLTKTDLATPESVSLLKQRLRALNPGAPIIHTQNGAVDPALLLNAGLYDPKTKSLDVQGWLNAEAYTTGHDHHHEAHDLNRHDDRISTTCLTLEEPIREDAFELWMQALTQRLGANTLRVKGIINVVGYEGPVVIHGVQHIFHTPIMLDSWPSDDRRTRIVLIMRDLDETMLQESLNLAIEIAGRVR